MSSSETRKLFGTDGIRGVANKDPMTAEVALRLGQAVAQRFRHPERPGRIVIGKDTRLSGYMLESALQAGIVSAGADVMLVGPLPTPGIAFITWSMRADAGVVISASHNPFQDNGIKIFAADGFKLPDEVEADLERRMENISDGGRGGLHDTAPDAIGKAIRIGDARGRYVQFLKNVFPKERTLDGIKVVVDCAHGAAYHTAPQVFEELGAHVIPLGVLPDGRNINEGVGALHPENMAAEVRRTGAQLGVALDGDADRVILADEKGTIVDGDEVMAILGMRMLERGTLPQKTVVATVMSNLGLERALAKRGGKLMRTAVGDRYVVEAMREKGLLLGGEQSGHIIFLDHATTGDGMVAALRVLAAMAETEQPLSELARIMTRYPQVLLNFAVAKKRPFEEMPAVTKIIASVESALGAEGRVVVRYSGTESKARVMIEGTDEVRIRAQANEIAEVLKASLLA
ncbi:MAG TPA: phosphoglucosamine mutase [Polyangia bacterium]|jgi:phosphoglucosamine mutase|nr:phosphoglucosamine mutase [Polyangia bacterium]